MLRVVAGLALAVLAFALSGWLGSAWASGLPQPYLLSGIAGDGTGFLIANNGRGAISWQACPPAPRGCSPAPRDPRGDPRGDQFVSAAGYPTGTVFIATHRDGGSVTSVPYQGPLVSTAPPSISGPVRADALVEPLPGRWSGGWGQERDRMQLQACPPSGNGRCAVLSDTIYANACPSAGAVIPPTEVGMVLAVVDQRMSAHTDIQMVDYLYGQIPPIIPGATASAATVGKIAPATTAPESNCGRQPPIASPPRPPSIRLQAPRWRNGMLVVGVISCNRVCRGQLVLRQRRVRVRQRFSITPTPLGPTGALLVIDGQRARQLHPGRATLAILATGTPPRRHQVVVLIRTR